MNNTLMPNFVAWADSLLDKEDVAIALEQAFNQGYSLGYMDGDDAWISDWDNAYLGVENGDVIDD